MTQANWTRNHKSLDPLYKCIGLTTGQFQEIAGIMSTVLDGRKDAVYVEIDDSGDPGDEIAGVSGKGTLSDGTKVWLSSEVTKDWVLKITTPDIWDDIVAQAARGLTTVLIFRGQNFVSIPMKAFSFSKVAHA